MIHSLEASQVGLKIYLEIQVEASYGAHHLPPRQGLPLVWVMIEGTVEVLVWARL